MKKYKNENNKAKLISDVDEEIISDESENDDDLIDKRDFEETNGKKRKKFQDEIDYSENENETAQEKKIRLIKNYLTQLESKTIGTFEERKDEVCQSNLISTHLKDSVLERMGKLYRTVADYYRLGAKKDIVVLKNGHRKSITAVVVSHDGRFVFTACKDCNLVKWDSASGKRLKTIYGNYHYPYRQNMKKFSQSHTDTINTLAISSDFKFLASGGANKVIHIWSPDTLTHLHTFHGHRSDITGLVFRRSFHQLYSCSADRTVKIWDLDEMAYVESLFGHQDAINTIDSFVRERCLTAGCRDGTIRLWKIPEESNLIFLTGGSAIVDCVKFINESHFLSASDNGSISLWGIFNKRPLNTIQEAHGSGYWITSLAVLKNTDLFASGSHNGQIIFWKIKPEFKGIERLFNYDVVGFVNGMEFTQDGQYLIAAISQEHRLGRWFQRFKEIRNIIHIIPLVNCDNKVSDNTQLNNCI